MAAVGDACDAIAGVAGASSVGLARSIPTILSAAGAAVLGMRCVSGDDAPHAVETAAD